MLDAYTVIAAQALASGSGQVLHGKRDVLVKVQTGSAWPRVVNRVLLLKSLVAGMIDLVDGAFRRNIFVTLSKFRKLVLDEPITVMIAEHREVLRALDHPSIRPLTKQYPNLANKYFGNYLAKSFPKSSRRDILKFHHRYLLDHLSESFFAQLLESEVVLWSLAIDGNRYCISLSHNHEWPESGDLKLDFAQNRVSIYELCFTFVPGRLINSTSDQVLLVTNVQGVRGKLEQIRQSMRTCDHVAPAYLLMTAAGAIAGALAIDVVAGVSNDQHLARTKSGSSEFFFDYDAFWKVFGTKNATVGTFEMSVPFAFRPLGHIKSNQRRRVQRRRQFAERVAACVKAAFAARFQDEL